MRKDSIALLEFGGWILSTSCWQHQFCYKKQSRIVYDEETIKDWSILMPIYSKFLSLWSNGTTNTLHWG